MATVVPMLSTCAAMMNASSTPNVRSSTLRVNIRRETTAVVRTQPAVRMAMISVERDSPSNEWSTTSSIVPFTEVTVVTVGVGERRKRKSAQVRIKSRAHICTRRYALIRLRIAAPEVVCGGGRARARADEGMWIVFHAPRSGAGAQDIKEISAGKAGKGKGPRTVHVQVHRSRKQPPVGARRSRITGLGYGDAAGILS